MVYDVTVIGGGPSGSQAAYRLAKRGHSVLVMEQKTSHQEPVCCTGIVSEQCLKEFEIDERVVLRHSDSASLFSPSGRLLRLERTTPQAATLDRPAFNSFMSRRAIQCGAEYLFNTRAADVSRFQGRLSITAATGDNTVKIESRAVVLATGSSSFLSESTGFGKPGQVVSGAQTVVELDNDAAEVSVYFGHKIAPGFFAWVVPTSQGRALAGLLAARNAKGRLAEFLDVLKDKGLVRGTVGEPISAPLPLKAMHRIYSDRALVVGTAAGLVKPTTGGGIYYGLLSADIAADVLHHGLAIGDLSGRIVGDYQRLVLRALGGELRAGLWGRRIFERLTDTQLDRAFDIMLEPGRVQMLMESQEVTFDRHSEAIAHLLRQRTLAKLINGTRFPFPGRHPAKERPFTKEIASDK